MAESYSCPLTEKSLKKAKEELNEDPKERISSVNTFRKWISEQPHLICPTDPGFLLAFLRGRKFSQLETRTLLEKFLSIKTKHKEWFEDIDPLNPAIQAVMKDGFAFKGKKKNAEGQTIMFVTYPRTEPWGERYAPNDVLRAFVMMSYECFLIDEETQVNGIVIVDDLTGMTLRHQTVFGLSELKSFMSGWHRNIPARVKKFVIYNVGTFAEFVLSIIKRTMPESLQDRFVNAGSNLENVYKEIPMEILPVEYLPDDYKGPNGGTMRGLVDDYMAHLSSPEVRARLLYLSSAKFGVDETKRPKDATAESFRKLNVD